MEQKSIRRSSARMGTPLSVKPISSALKQKTDISFDTMRSFLEDEESSFIKKNVAESKRNIGSSYLEESKEKHSFLQDLEKEDFDEDIEIQNNFFESFESFNDEGFLEIETLFESPNEKICRVYDKNLKEILLQKSYFVNPKDEEAFQINFKKFNKFFTDKNLEVHNFSNPKKIFCGQNTFDYQKVLILQFDDYVCSLDQLFGTGLSEEEILFVLEKVVNISKPLLKKRSVDFSTKDILIFREKEKMLMKFDFNLNSATNESFSVNNLLIETILTLAGKNSQVVELIKEKPDRINEYLTEFDNINFLVNSYLSKKLDYENLKNYLEKTKRKEISLKSSALNYPYFFSLSKNEGILYGKKVASNYENLGYLLKAKDVLIFITENLEQKHDYDSIFSDLATIHYKLSEFQNAQKLLDILSSHQDFEEKDSLENNKNIIQIEFPEKNQQIFDSFQNLLSENENKGSKVNIEHNLGFYYYRVGKFDFALNFAETAVQNKRILLENDRSNYELNFSLFVSLINLGTIYFYKGMNEQAEEIANEAKDIKADHFSNYKQHAYESIYLNILLSQINLRNSKIQTAIDTCEETLDYFKKMVGPDNSLTFNILKILIEIFVQEKNYDNVFKLIEGFPQSFQIRNLHAMALRQMGSIYYESCLNTQEKIFEEMSDLDLTETPLFYNISINLAQTYLLLNQKEKAFDIASSISNIQRISKVTLAEAEACLANYYSKQNNLELSINYYNLAFNNYSESKGEVNEFCRICTKNLGKILIKKKEYNTALEFYEKSLEICTGLGNQNFIDTTRSEFEKLRDFAQDKFL